MRTICLIRTVSETVATECTQYEALQVHCRILGKRIPDWSVYLVLGSSMALVTGLCKRNCGGQAVTQTLSAQPTVTPFTEERKRACPASPQSAGNNQTLNFFRWPERIEGT